MTPLIFYLSAAIILAGFVSVAYAQVEITQSQSTSTNNGNEEQLIKTVNDITTIKVLQGGTIQLTNDPNQFKIKYCNPDSDCHTYKLDHNGIMILEQK
jgi:hypothetical protein